MQLKVVDSYFRSEDEALSAMTELRKIGASGLRIERMIGEDGQLEMPDIAFTSPIFPTSTSSKSSTVVNSRMPLYEIITDFGGKKGEAKALLSYHIAPEKLEQSLMTVSEYGGKIQ